MNKAQRGLIKLHSMRIYLLCDFVAERSMLLSLVSPFFCVIVQSERRAADAAVSIFLYRFLFRHRTERILSGGAVRYSIRTKICDMTCPKKIEIYLSERDCFYEVKLVCFNYSKSKFKHIFKSCVRYFKRLSAK